MKFPLDEQLINALCHTFVQSLWQGVLLAATAGIIIICTQKKASAIRYNLLVSALLVFASGVFITFLMQLGNGQHVTATTVYTIQQSGTYVGPVQPIAPAGFTASLSGYLNRHSNTIVLVWLFIICIKIIQLTVGLYGTYRLKHSQVFSVSGHCQELFEQLVARMGIKQHIRMLESGLCKVPVVIGSLKPIILIPLGLLNSLSYEETEVILLHELAHIRRLDFLVNLLQNLLEIIFFFNPAVLWVSQLIKTERENCCDDLALGQTADKANYIRALLSCEEYRAATPSLAMAFPGNKHGLLRRVKRLANNRNHSLNPVEKTVLAFCLILSLACLTALTKREAEKKVAAAFPQQQILKTPLVSDFHKSPNTDPVSFKQKPVPPKPNPVQKRTDPHENAPAESIVDTLPDSPKTETAPLFKRPVYAYETIRPYGEYGYRRAIFRPHVQTQAERDSVLHEILIDMLKDGIIASPTDDLVFSLSRKGFIVNDKLANDKVLERYWVKYGPANNDQSWTWTHSYHH
jgi:beta-lactamase regulating signal transducer with metallopeptidase domain